MFGEFIVNVHVHDIVVVTFAPHWYLFIHHLLSSDSTNSSQLVVEPVTYSIDTHTYTLKHEELKGHVFQKVFNILILCV